MAKERRRYHHGDLRGALVSEAITVLDRSPDAEITLRGLAKHIGVSPMAPYAHFDDKDALLDAVAVEGFAALQKALKAAKDSLREPVSPEEALSALARAYIDFGLKRPGLYRVMFARPAAAKGTSVRNAGERAFAHLVDLFSADNRDGRQNAEQAWSMAHGLTLLVGTGFIQEQPDLEQHIAAIGRLLSPKQRN